MFSIIISISQDTKSKIEKILNSISASFFVINKILIYPKNVVLIFKPFFFIPVNELSTNYQSSCDSGIQSPTPTQMSSISSLSSGSNTIGASAGRSQTLQTNISRSVSQKPAMGRPSLNFSETDSAVVKRKPSTPLLNVWNRGSKGMGSQEDLSSLSTSTSMTSLTSTISQMQTCQSLKDRLGDLLVSVLIIYFFILDLFNL